MLEILSYKLCTEKLFLGKASLYKAGTTGDLNNREEEGLNNLLSPEPNKVTFIGPASDGKKFGFHRILDQAIHKNTGFKLYTLFFLSKTNNIDDIH